MPKITVYVPDQLAERLTDATVNVSAICQEALTAELDRTDALRQLYTDDRLAAARQRLAETSVETEQDEYENGKEDGREWAIEEATHRELRLLELWTTGGGWPGPRFPEVDGQSFPTLEGWMDHYTDRYDRAMLDRHAFFRGFAEGAVEALHAINRPS